MTRENLMKMKVDELKEMAKKKGVAGASKLKKDELVYILSSEKVFEVKTTEEVSYHADHENPMKLKEIHKRFKGVEKVGYVCPVCGARIYHPEWENFCFNCGQKLETMR